MKVLKVGTNVLTKTFRTKCAFCDSELEYLGYEGKIKGSYLSIDCPICNQEITTSVLAGIPAVAPKEGSPYS